MEDRLVPSITVTVFFGSEEWDGPLSLFGMMDVSDPEVLAEVVNVCQAIQEMRKESERDGELKKAREAAGKLYEMGLDTDKIAQAVGYAVETVKGWLGLES